MLVHNLICRKYITIVNIWTSYNVPKRYNRPLIAAIVRVSRFPLEFSKSRFSVVIWQEFESSFVRRDRIVSIINERARGTLTNGSPSLNQYDGLAARGRSLTDFFPRWQGSGGRVFAPSPCYVRPLHTSRRAINKCAGDRCRALPHHCPRPHISPEHSFFLFTW